MNIVEFVYFKTSILKKPNAPFIFSNPSLARECYDQLWPELPDFHVTFHECSGLQAIYMTDKARKRLSRILKSRLLDLRLEVDTIRAAIDEIEDAFAASGRG